MPKYVNDPLQETGKQSHFVKITELVYVHLEMQVFNEHRISDLMHRI